MTITPLFANCSHGSSQQLPPAKGPLDNFTIWYRRITIVESFARVWNEVSHDPAARSVIWIPSSIEKISRDSFRHWVEWTSISFEAGSELSLLLRLPCMGAVYVQFRLSLA
jgi:hypothetical protein